MANWWDRRLDAKRRRARLHGNVRRVAMACACALPLLASGDLLVPAGGQVSVNGGTVFLACTDFSSSGTTNVGSGSLLGTGDLTIQPGGVVNGGTGLIVVNQSWSNNGSFVAGTGEVDFRENCGGAPASISGNTTFSTVSFQSASGKSYFFAAGSTQTITTLLQISGTAANPIEFRSSSPSQAAFINLLPTGAQQIQDVGVTDAWATGQPLAPSETNLGGGGNALGWFGVALTAVSQAIPALSNAALVALAMLLTLSVALNERRRRVLTRSSRTESASQ